MSARALRAIAVAASCAACVAPQPAVEHPVHEPISSEHDPRIAEARVELESPRPARIAWGAYHASHGQMRELAPDVAAALTRARDLDPAQDRVWVVRALLDAAIQLDVRPSRAELEWLIGNASQLSAATLILAARNPDASTSVLRHFDASSSQHAWLAAQNLLAARAPRELAPRLLRAVRIEFVVSVIDPDSGVGRGGSSRSRACGSLEAPPDFPPSVEYSLRERGGGAPDVFADGPTPIGYEREVYVTPKFNLSAFYTTLDRAAYELRLLRWIAGDRPKESELQRRVDFQHTWSDPDSYRNAVGAAIETRRARFAELLRELRDRNVLDESAARTELPIDVRVEDHRADKSIELRPLPY